MFRVFDYLCGADIVRRDVQLNISEKIYRLNKKFLHHITKILSIMFPRFLSLSTLLFILLLVIVISLEFIIYQVGLVSGKFYKTINKKDLSEFRDLVILSVLLIILNAFVKSLVDFVASLLRIIWRKYITLYLNENYFKNKNFYFIQLNFKNVPVSPHRQQRQSTALMIDRGDTQSNISGNFKLDNPDQRITQDVDSICLSMSTILPIILISPFVIGYYSYQAFDTAGYLGPLSVFCYFIVGALLNGPLMSPIAAVVYLQDKLEGNFRYKHMSIRSHAESVAFYNSGENELKQTNKIFTDLLSISYRRNWREFLLKVCVNTLQFLGGILSYLTLAIPIFANLYDNLTPAELNEFISNYSFKCNYLVYLFTRLYDLSNAISLIAGNSHRVGQLIDIIKSNETAEISKQNNEANVNNGYQAGSNTESVEHNLNVCFKAVNLSVMTPNHSRVLIKNLNFTFEINKNVLITGRSGCGKTALFRSISGLWNSFDGELILTQKEFQPCFIIFLPQTPYFTNGTLLEQIIYPTSVESVTLTNEMEISIINWLKKFNLENLLEKVNNNLQYQQDFNWQSILSLGEQQRLSFLRVLYHNPKFALLDEFTSSVDQESEILMYETLKQMNITYLSIAHRDTVRHYHSIELKILNNGEYELKDIIDNTINL